MIDIKTAMRAMGIPCAVLLIGLCAMLVPADSPSDEQRSADVPLVIPEEEKERQNPVPLTEEVLTAGMSLFVSQCGMCHGPLGKGDGDLALKLELETPDFTDPVRQKARTDGELFYILTVGHGAMPSQGKRLPDDWKWELVHVIRALGSKQATGPQ